MVSMDWLTCLLLLLVFLTFASGLFTVEVDRSSYTSELGGNVVMGCRFQTSSPALLSRVTILWHWISPAAEAREVYRLDNAAQQLNSQHPSYRGRASLLTEEIQSGWAKIQVSDLRISDGGKYQCFVQTEAGADYGTVTLSVFAPYKVIRQRVERVSEGEVRLWCESEGYPEPDVTWRNDRRLELRASTTTESSAEQLYKVTSTITVTSLHRNIYSCHFSTDHAAIITIPDDIPASTKKNSVSIVVLFSSLTLTGIILIFVMYKFHQKGLKSTSPGNVSEPRTDSLNDEEKTKMTQTAGVPPQEQHKHTFVELC